ncbi:MAG: hypothetical protein IJX77_09020 [Ruminococcus sp.]|nr:hypothetical protein [Ruminococcus sp.]
MKELIKGYVNGCELLRQRICELTEQMNTLRKKGNTLEIEELDLVRRIQLLYTEHRQTKETIEYLESYMRRVEERVKKKAV